MRIGITPTKAGVKGSENDPIQVWHARGLNGVQFKSAHFRKSKSLPTQFMARKTVRVDVPINSPDAMIKLAEDIKKQHDKPTANSPLKAERVEAMGERSASAKTKRAKADELEAEAGQLRNEADTLIGTAPGQTSETLNTLHNDITGFRDALLVENRGNEEALSQYGFNVVVGTAAARTRTPAAKRELAGV